MSLPQAAEKNAPVLGDVLEFLSQLWELDHSLERRSKRMARELGITGPQRLVLRIVGRFPGIPPKELAALLFLHPSTLTGILVRLEGAGLLERRPDPRDRRRTRLGLTERGRELDRSAPGTIEDAVRRVMERLPPRELEAARCVLREIAHELGGAG